VDRCETRYSPNGKDVRDPPHRMVKNDQLTLESKDKNEN